MQYFIISRIRLNVTEDRESPPQQLLDFWIGYKLMIYQFTDHIETFRHETRPLNWMFVLFIWWASSCSITESQKNWIRTARSIQFQLIGCARIRIFIMIAGQQEKTGFIWKTNNILHKNHWREPWVRTIPIDLLLHIWVDVVTENFKFFETEKMKKANWFIWFGLS